MTYVMMSKESSDFTILSHLIRCLSFLKFTFIDYFQLEMKSRHLVLTRDVTTLLNQ